MKKTTLITLLFIAIWGGVLNCQVKNGAVFNIAGGSKIQGELLSSDSVYKVRLLDQSVYSINKSSVTSAYLPEDITLFANGKYNLNRGVALYLSTGINGNGAAFDIYGGYRLGNGFEAGMGFGFHENSFTIPVVNNNFNWYWVNSTPLYLSGKYFFLRDKLINPYAKIQFGINNNRADWGITKINNGLMFETGVGVAFSGRRRTRMFCELLQYNTHAKGIANNEVWDWNTGTVISNTDINFNIWINTIMFRFGLFINFLD